jgi:hypothetical protein
MVLTAFFDSQRIPVGLLKQSRETEVDFTWHLTKLQAFSLVVPTKKGCSVDVYRLVQLVTRAWVKGRNETAMWQKAALHSVENRFQYLHRQSEREELLPHAEAVTHYPVAGKEQETIFVSLLDCMTFTLSHSRRGDLVAALECLTKSFNILQNQYPVENESIVRKLVILARHLNDCNTQDKALGELKSNLNTAEKLFGPSRDIILPSLWGILRRGTLNINYDIIEGLLWRPLEAFDEKDGPQSLGAMLIRVMLGEFPPAPEKRRACPDIEATSRRK